MNVQFNAVLSTLPTFSKTAQPTGQAQAPTTPATASDKVELSPAVQNQKIKDLEAEVSRLKATPTGKANPNQAIDDAGWAVAKTGAKYGALTVGLTGAALGFYSGISKFGHSPMAFAAGVFGGAVGFALGATAGTVVGGIGGGIVGTIQGYRQQGNEKH